MCLAIPGQVETVDAETRLASVSVMGVKRKVNIDLLRSEPLDVGDWVLIHVGFAMSKISPEQAEEQMKLLEMLGELAEAQEEVEGYGSDHQPEDAEGVTP
ncbi:MAG: HypC/HybG/HupF family hydrogenase formation chaperone [Planctomycetota bacterium]